MTQHPRRPPSDEARRHESRATLDRAQRDSETLGTSALARGARQAADHFAARDAVGDSESGATDPIELWGRRIGRALSAVGFVALAIYLIVTYVIR